MAPEASDLRTRILDDLLERVREDQYPSATMLDMIESMLRQDDEVEQYADVLFEKVSEETYPSLSLMRRLQSLVV